MVFLYNENISNIRVSRMDDSVGGGEDVNIFIIFVGASGDAVRRNIPDQAGETDAGEEYPDSLAAGLGGAGGIS